jgi:hypothetical protein
MRAAGSALPQSSAKNVRERQVYSLHPLFSLIGFARAWLDFEEFGFGLEKPK